MAMTFRLSVLNQSRVLQGQNPLHSIKHAIDLAGLLEQLGYDRYWLSEHHADDAAHSSPELLVPMIGLMTQRLRVGVAGILLRYHNPYKVAKDFRLLHGLFPGRVDLGIARGTIIGPAHAAFLEPTDDSVLEEKISALLSYIGNSSSVMMHPVGVISPQIWMLGKLGGARSAGAHGTAFAVAMFMARPGIDDARVMVNEYRRSFRPSRDMRFPQWAMAVGGVCAETEEKARKLAATSTSRWCVPTVVGNPKQCQQIFHQLQAEFGTDQYVFFDMCDREEDKLASYELIARELKLTVTEPEQVAKSSSSAEGPSVSGRASTRPEPISAVR